MPQSNGLKLRSAIDAAIAASLNLSDMEIATSVDKADPDLVHAWALEQVAGIARKRRGARPVDSQQLTFPFHDPSIQIPLKGGPIELRTATIGKLREAEAVLLRKRIAAVQGQKSRPDSLLGKIQREIEIMQPYSYGNPRITVEQFHDLRTKGVPVPEKTEWKMSEVMRRFWDAKSPEERAAHSKKMNAARWAKRKTRRAK
jgi:hypothetical protein